MDHRPIREQWEEINRANSRALDDLRQSGIVISDLGDRWHNHLLKALLGDRYDQVRLDYEQELSLFLAETKRNREKILLRRPGQVPGNGTARR